MFLNLSWIELNTVVIDTQRCIDNYIINYIHMASLQVPLTYNLINKITTIN